MDAKPLVLSDVTAAIGLVKAAAAGKNVSPRSKLIALRIVKASELVERLVHIGTSSMRADHLTKARGNSARGLFFGKFKDEDNDDYVGSAIGKVKNPGGEYCAFSAFV